MIIYVGSMALMAYINDIGRTPKDVDVICSYDELIHAFGKQPVMYPIAKGNKFFMKNEDTIYEAELTWEDRTASKFYKMVLEDNETYFKPCDEGDVAIPSFNALYMLKMSHRYLKDSPHFLKTMRDIQLMRQHGAEITPYWKDFYKERIKETYWYKHPKLMDASKKGFFTDNVKYIYDHDDIHKAIAVYGVPAYTLYMKDGAQVDCDKSKFFALPEDVRINGVLEEAYVLALERHQIPNEYRPNPDASFNIALMKVCTSITSGWFREFAWENYDKVLYKYTLMNPYVEKFRMALNNGKVKLHS